MFTRKTIFARKMLDETKIMSDNDILPIITDNYRLLLRLNA